MYRIVYSLLIFILLLEGCSNKPCLNNTITPVFIGFSQADIDTIVLRAFKPNDNYLHLIDTVVIVNKGASIYTIKNDTTIVFVNSSNPNDWINPDFNWQVYLPAKNKTTSISNIRATQTEGSGRSCLNPINSFEQDGQSITAFLTQSGYDYTSGYMAFIHN